MQRFENCICCASRQRAERARQLLKRIASVPLRSLRQAVATLSSLRGADAQRLALVMMDLTYALSALPNAIRYSMDSVTKTTIAPIVPSNDLHDEPTSETTVKRTTSTSITGTTNVILCFEPQRGHLAIDRNCVTRASLRELQFAQPCSHTGRTGRSAIRGDHRTPPIDCK